MVKVADGFFSFQESSWYSIWFSSSLEDFLKKSFELFWLKSYILHTIYIILKYYQSIIKVLTNCRRLCNELNKMNYFSNIFSKLVSTYRK